MSHFSVGVFTETNSFEEVEKLLAPYQENNMGDCPKEYLSFVEDEDSDVDEETGLHGYWENLNAKWDWYQIGGRWHGMLVTNGTSGKRGNPSLCCSSGYREDEFDSALVSEIDFDAMKQRRIQKTEPYEICFERKFYKPEYFLKMYQTEDAYIQDKTSFSTYAVITPDGEWHAKGEMGWFGLGTETPESKKEFLDNFKKKFIEPAIKNGWYLTIVDCHI